MENFHHKAIKKFNLNGIIHDESAIARLRWEYHRLLVSEMRIAGYVPRFDIDPDFTLDYNPHKRIFEFELTMHGVYVGRKQSQCIAGIDATTAIYIQPNKLKESSQAQA